MPVNDHGKHPHSPAPPPCRRRSRSRRREEPPTTPGSDFQPPDPPPPRIRRKARELKDPTGPRAPTSRARRRRAPQSTAAGEGRADTKHPTTSTTSSKAPPAGIPPYPTVCTGRRRGSPTLPLPKQPTEERDPTPRRRGRGGSTGSPQKSPSASPLFNSGGGEDKAERFILMPPCFHGTEENAFMELLRFMYTGKLTPTTEPTLLVDIWVAADKFEVASCMSLCSQRLGDLPMTPESAVLYLDLPSSISVAADLTEAAKKYLSKRYKEFVSPKFQDELMRIPLAGIVAILSRSDLLAVSEVAVYDFVLRWAFTQYPSSEERCKILSSRLLPLVPRMHGMNKAVQTNEPNRKLNFFLKRERCSWLYQSRSVYPCQEFCFAGNVFFLSFHCNSGCFGLSLQMLQDKGPVKGTIDYKFQAKTRPLLRYVTMYECTSADSRGAVGCEDLFAVPWLEFIADDSPFFIDGILYLQIHLKLTQKPL